MTKCSHCGGYGKVPYRQSQSDRQCEIERALEAQDFQLATFLKMTNNTVTAMKCQKCDGTGCIAV